MGVLYRNQDQASNYFTHLVWAETENVGCGRAKFNVHNVTVDRLVCNFSPKGNIHGRPIYSIGYPRTQCKNKMAPIEKLKGLCTQHFTYKAKLPVNVPVSSLLKILNLSNDSIKQEIDPIYNNMKQIIPHRNEMEKPKHPIMRHVFGSKLQTKRQDYPYSQRHRFWENPVNGSRKHKEHFQSHEIIYPKHDHSRNQKYNTQSTKSDQKNDYRKHMVTIVSDDESANGFENRQCTRSTQSYDRGCQHTKQRPNQNSFQCTRGQKNNWQTPQNSKLPSTNIIPNKWCPCSTGYPSINTQRSYKISCECGISNGITIRCPNLHRNSDDVMQNEGSALESDKLKVTNLNPEDEYEWLLNKRRKSIPENKESYIHSNRNRYKRDFSDTSSFKPFWQIDGFSYDGHTQLKSLRYTTLPNKRRHKTKKLSSKSLTTESITIQFKNTNTKPITDKYLSFDELLHLRKFNLSGNNAQRRMEPEILRHATDATKDKTIASQTQTTAEFTTNYTANTPFKRMKHCTRKLTCTWTAHKMTDSNGSVIGNIDRGSRTPPGYVEGCTRTSTCTRDFLNRNKFPTSTGSSNGDDEESDEDGNNNSDYCERRSLNLGKRNSNQKRSFEISETKKNYTSFTRFSYSQELSNYNTLNSNFRKKRSHAKHKCSQNNLSYGDLYYLVLSKIVKAWQNKKLHDTHCPCNGTTGRDFYINFILIFFMDIFIFL